MWAAQAAAWSAGAAAATHLSPLPPLLNRWQRLRWRPTSHDEGVYYERRLLDMLKGSYTQADVRVGPGAQDFIHTVAGGAANADCPPFVAIPGYSSGSAFLFKIFDGLSAAFRLYAVDLLGTGLSGT